MFKAAIPLSVISVKQYHLFHVVRCQKRWINVTYILILTVITQFLYSLKCATKLCSVGGDNGEAIDQVLSGHCVCNDGHRLCTG